MTCLRVFVAALALSTFLPNLSGATVADDEVRVCETADAPQPTPSLAFGSRYRDDSKTRSDLDPEGDAEVTAALKPVDDFIRIITREANKVLEGDDAEWRADCVVGAIRAWADARALEDLQTLTARLSVGARIAGVSLAYIQVRNTTTRKDDLFHIDLWLRRMNTAQVLFWEEGATSGAQKGNLRAWAALGFAASGLAMQDRFLLEEAARTINLLMCTANEDGSLPQEMRRGKYALHYQFHATAPLVFTRALLQRQSLETPMPCASNLVKIVEFGLSDMADGSLSQAYNGKQQSYFDGTATFEQHEFAWLVAMATMPEFQAHADLPLANVPAGPYRNSKLGGNQDLLWSDALFLAQ